MDPRLKKRILWGAGGILALFFVLIIALLIFRGKLLEYSIARVTQKVERRYPVDFTIGKAEFTDLRSVVLSNITLVPHGRDTLFTTDSVRASVSLRSIFKGRIVFRRLEVANGYITARRDSTGNNFSFLLKRDESLPADTSEKTTRNYGRLLNNLIETAFDNVPDQVFFRNLNVSYVSTNRTIDVRMPYLTIDDGEIDSQVSIQVDTLRNNMRVHGAINPRSYVISASLFAFDERGIKVPYVKSKFGGEISFDTLYVSLTDKTFKRDILTVKGAAMVNDLFVNHERLATEDIHVNEAAIDYSVSIGPNLYVIDSLTEVRVNKVKANVFASYNKGEPNIIDLKVKTKDVPANDFFESLPTGLFENLEGIKAEGLLKYKMSFHLNMDSVEAVRFDSDLDASKNFKIVEYGSTNLEKINGSFSHTVYEYGKPVRTFTVGPANNFYTPIDQISPYLRNAILTAEDAYFYRHKGFHEEAFRQAIAKNIQERDFKRGGSTISMQLVKNVFLTRQKTVTRKVEEAIIVWLLENQRLVSKHRMFEVYLNIIEWGPEIYGAKDASRFYFGKQPSELTLAEAIFLTSIIPSPKRYRSSFDSAGNLRSYKAGYYRLIGGHMARRGLISQEEYDNLYPNVRLSGRARDIIVTAPDTTEEDPRDFELETIDMLGF
ncbi:penicillin-binding protein [Pontibacter qinzhouensis]|uniref:Penicillin-binding protein n=1 Tax=Pontibacter qinzhouensis TaxID=2603253 RepID=A0A5C8K9P6_9BACT|nr:biosynthetic peptidoglycan transglycosylase [Pontibacter qinzhouensis]TXK48610.1 penicillin-binding protein [Pontibacter qinzhouensis]